MEDFKYNHIVIRYGELSTKGKNRKDFINRLYQNIKEFLDIYPNLKYEKTHDRLFIELNGEPHEEIINILKNIFGISSFSLSIKIDNDIEQIKEVCLNMAKENNFETFKINTKRSNKNFHMTSDQINRDIATTILKNTNYKVDVKNPQLLINIELKDEHTYIIYKTYKGVAGYPVGSNGRALLMMSGGIDSPVAGYLTSKRGLRLVCIHYASPPYTSPSARQKVLDLIKKLNKFQANIKLYVVPFTDIQVKIYDNADESYAITLMRRMMYKIADEIAKKERCLVISNGESLGQVASQTLESMTVITKGIDTLVTRPLFSYDKLEIIDIAKKIDTYETSILPFDDCCTIFNPKNPTTKPKLDKVLYYEDKVDYNTLIDQAISSSEILYIDNKDKNLF